MILGWLMKRLQHSQWLNLMLWLHHQCKLYKSHWHIQNLLGILYDPHFQSLIKNKLNIFSFTSTGRNTSSSWSIVEISSTNSTNRTGFICSSGLRSCSWSICRTIDTEVRGTIKMSSTKSSSSWRWTSLSNSCSVGHSTTASIWCLCSCFTASTSYTGIVGTFIVF